MYDDFEDDDYEDEPETMEPADGSLTFVVSGYTASKIDDVVESQLRRLVTQAVEKKLDATVDSIIQEKVAALADDDITKRLENELDICVEEGWNRTDTWGESCGGKVTLKARVMEYLNGKLGHSSKQQGEAVLRKVLDKKTQEMISAFAEELREKLRAETDALIRKRVDADSTIAAQLQATVLELFGAGKAK